MAASTWRKWLPTISTPLIVSAPMRGHAGGRLAAEVTKAGGFGFIAAGFDFAKDSAELKALEAELEAAHAHLCPSANEPLPVGVGFITGHSTIVNFNDQVLSLVRKYRPLSVWLFAPDPDVQPHARIAEALKATGSAWGLKTFVQVGNVAAARDAVKDGADVIVAQGIDAGGHQFIQGSGIVALVPEIKDMLRAEFPEKNINLLAAGGIADGNGVAAALALGADGAVMGTRFIVADEAVGAQHRKQAVLEAVDGGISTFKSPFNDQINNSKLWGPLYDGRAIKGPLHDRFLSGSSVEELRDSLKNDFSAEDQARAVNNWAGTGVGLVRRLQPAKEIVEEVRDAARQRIQDLNSMLEA